MARFSEANQQTHEKIEQTIQQSVSQLGDKLDSVSIKLEDGLESLKSSTAKSEERLVEKIAKLQVVIADRCNASQEATTNAVRVSTEECEVLIHIQIAEVIHRNDTEIKAHCIEAVRHFAQDGNSIEELRAQLETQNGQTADTGCKQDEPHFRDCETVEGRNVTVTGCVISARQSVDIMDEYAMRTGVSYSLDADSMRTIISGESMSNGRAGGLLSSIASERRHSSVRKTVYSTTVRAKMKIKYFPKFIKPTLRNVAKFRDKVRQCLQRKKIGKEPGNVTLYDRHNKSPGKQSNTTGHKVNEGIGQTARILLFSSKSQRHIQTAKSEVNIEFSNSHLGNTLHKQ